MTTFFFIIQFFFCIVIGVYFFNLLRAQQGNKGVIERESKKELQKIRRLRDIHLTAPLSEKTRPVSLNDIVGQQQGIRALRAAICGPNPQHVIIYGPPGVGKTAAARVVLEEAKTLEMSPFAKNANFVEIDATTLRFDERGIADPLIGSVHDPIYQGAGAYGAAGVPQPRPGAVTKAHGGILFIDEIGELPSIQMNKLLKVLEDRCVFLESSYYSAEDSNIPLHIHDIFQKGLPADFRLIGATTRTPDEIPAAIRSRCVEIFFRQLRPEELCAISENAAAKGGFHFEEGVERLISSYARNGRDAVNVVQSAGGICQMENRSTIRPEDVQWVLDYGHYSPRFDKKVATKTKPDTSGADGMINDMINDDAEVTMRNEAGCVNGLAVVGSTGHVIDIEVALIKVASGKGSIKVTGIVEQEEMEGRGYRFKRNSTARSSVENVVTVLRKFFDIDLTQFDIHLDFPGGMPIDGPSAGISMAVALYSAITDEPVSPDTALTGEISVTGRVRPVGGIASKIEAAREAGIHRVFIPIENAREAQRFADMDIVPVETIDEVILQLFNGTGSQKRHIHAVN